MMTLPDDLPPSLYPLAWLLGSWRGWGTAPAMGEEGEDRPLVFALDVTHDGDDLRHHLRVSYAEAADGIDVMADAARGLALLTPRDEAWEETGTWHLTRSEPAQGPGTETFGEGTLRLRGGRFGGEGLWAIRCQGPRIGARISDIDGLSENGTRIVEASRMYGLVGGELMWAEEAALNGEDIRPAVTARLAREDA
ncbi:heme-binding beta-barrel domain-containing protein [Nanchangia anserum]|uniref:FABP family protein n=1 Tax=Nanchangia anserum TaxID=2692125 RepID=A0A8I0KVY6_9ACTO|nr:heme-binding beta-barrel domain-containing protein [Nanchangia anserum]MBD3689439.1 FABP family protein [Nanchangia anserum]